MSALHCSPQTYMACRYTIRALKIVSVNLKKTGPNCDTIRHLKLKEISFISIYETRNHPEMVGDMSHVTLNFDLSKIPFVRF